MNEADLILALGSSSANHTGIDRSKPIIQVDFERMQLGRFHPVALPVWGEIGAFCAAIAPRLRRPPDAPDQRTELAQRWAMWRDEKRRRLLETRGQGLHVAAVFDALTRLCPADAIIAVDVGNAQLGKITKEQRAGEWPVWETSLNNPSFAMFARQCGGHGVRVSAAEVMTDAELI